MQNQNYYMATCLHYYKSRELDSIANLAFEKLQRSLEEYYGKKNIKK